MRTLLKKLSFAIGIMFCSMNILCEEDIVNFDNDSFCDNQVIVDESLYQDIQSADFEFIEAEIIDDCLSIEFGASGCDGNSWAFKLVDSGAVAESLPEQRFLKVQLINEELCDAYFEKIISFDLALMQINGSNEIILHIEGLEPSLNYKY